MSTSCTVRTRTHARCVLPVPWLALQAVYQIAADLAGLAAVADKRFGPASAAAAPGTGTSKSCGGCSGAKSAAAGSLSMAALNA